MEQRKTLLLGSILKPIDDTRMYEKFGITIAEKMDFDVHIVGFKSSQNVTHPKIHFHPIFNFRRLSIKRWLAKWKFLKLILKVKPKVLIVNTHELLIVSYIYRILFGCSIVYDIQENYYLNIRYGNSFNKLIKRPLAYYVRAKENLYSKYIQLFILAEDSYATELKFLNNRYEIVRNSYAGPESKKSTPFQVEEPIKLVYTGTVSLTYGVLEAIDLHKQLRTFNSKTTLLIIGHCPDQRLFKQLEAKSKSIEGIELEVNTKPIPHEKILKALKNASFSIISYQSNESVINCFPTKIYESLALKVPMLIRNNLPWVKYCDQFSSCVSYPGTMEDMEHIYVKMLQTRYFAKDLPSSIYWSNEQNKLISALSNIT